LPSFRVAGTYCGFAGAVSCNGTFTNVSATGVRGYLVQGDVNVDSAADFSLQIYTSPTNDLPGGAAGWSLAAWDFFL
jgi:hypothetical protein